MRYPLLVVAALSACAGAPTHGGDPEVVATPSGRIALRIVRPVHDPKQQQETSKVFHHVYAPDGRLLTKGTGGQFGHHRGLFIGWNRLRWNGQRHDFWHCNEGETQRFRDFLGTDIVDDGWQGCEIDWCTSTGECALTEYRALRARDVSDDVIAIDMQVALRANGHTAHLAGDPQHAGQQFRALQMFAEENGPKVDYLRPAGAKQQGNDVWTGCAWIAAVLPLPERDVTILRIEHPDNDKPVTWSTRNYGRFGATITRDLAAGQQMHGYWTYVIALGRRDLGWCEATATATIAAMAQSPARGSLTIR